MMEVSLGYRCWSVIQVVAMVACYHWRVSSAERVQGCVESQLSLSCPETKVIWITSVVLGDSYCTGTSCCIKHDDCTQDPNNIHRTDVHRRCDNKQNCTVDVVQEKINCGYLGFWPNNDFERITYDCRDEPRRLTTATPSRPSTTEKKQLDEDTEDDETTSSIDDQTTEASDTDANEHGGSNPSEGNPQNTTWLWLVVMAIVCLLVFIAIVVVVVMLRRKRLLKIGSTVELTDIDSSERNEPIYANDNQPSLQKNPVYSNHKIQRSRDNGSKAPPDRTTYEIPNDVVYSDADDTGSRPSEDPSVYCEVDSREPAYQTPRPRSNIYSVVRNIGEPVECAGSTADAPHEDNSVYCEVETREPAKVANSSSVNANDEAYNWKESDSKAIAADITKKTTSNPVHKADLHSYANVSKPSTALDSKALDSKERVSSSDGFPTPTYETMSPGIPEGIYANEPVLSPSWSPAPKALSTAESDTENPYFDMQSPKLRFKDDGGQTVVENDLYVH